MRNESLSPLTPSTSVIDARKHLSSVADDLSDTEVEDLVVEFQELARSLVRKSY